MTPPGQQRRTILSNTFGWQDSGNPTNGTPGEA